MKRVLLVALLPFAVSALAQAGTGARNANSVGDIEKRLMQLEQQMVDALVGSTR